MRSPFSRVTPSASTWATPEPSRHDTPSSVRAWVMTGRGPSPRSGPKASARSTMMTFTAASAPSTSRRRSGISAAVSIPVKPAPAITTVLRPAFSGRSARCSRCTCNRAASAI
ncbi:hypothetical protein G6F32_015402 [Rhizopus arrhizus]|nr:hypothetical protein G6F32_015402 [Rhizopus arrhizus]